MGVDNINFLYLLGIIGIVSQFFYVDIFTVVGSQTGETGTKLIQDIITGFHNFLYIVDKKDL